MEAYIMYNILFDNREPLTIYSTLLLFSLGLT